MLVPCLCRACAVLVRVCLSLALFLCYNPFLYVHQAEAMEVAAHDDHVTGGVSTPSATATATIAGSRRSRSNRPNVSHNERTRVGAILPILGLMMACSTPVVGAGGTKRKQCDNQEEAVR